MDNYKAEFYTVLIPQHGGEVEKQLEGKAFVARLSTSKSLGDPGLLQEVALVMSYLDFDVVHFNNGMHGFDYSEQEWGAALPGLLETIREFAPGAKLIWAHTTPYRSGENMDEFAPRNERVLERNRIATEFFKWRATPENERDLSPADVEAIDSREKPAEAVIF